MSTTRPARTAAGKSAQGRLPGSPPGNESDLFPEDDGTYEVFRVTCPDCRRPIGVFPEEEVLPRHAVCASAWDPFGLTVCPGSGRAAADAETLDDGSTLDGREVAALLTLPEGLDWRTQPFSHAGVPARP